MKTWDELTEEQQEKAIERVIGWDLDDITEGSLRFNDEQNDDDLQEIIDGIVTYATTQQTPWFAKEMIWEGRFTPRKGHATHDDGKWPISDTLRGLAVGRCVESLYPETGEWVIEGIA